MISKNLEELRALDKDNKMFDVHGKFRELKSSLLTPSLKHKFARYLCDKSIVEVYFIRVENTKVDTKLYEKTARAFNYIIGLALKFYFKNGWLPNDDYLLHIDERNTKTGARHSLEDYLYIDLVIIDSLVNSIGVEYFESFNNRFIQIADFFSNLYYSKCHSTKYNKLFNEMVAKGYFRHEFIFPYNGNH